MRVPGVHPATACFRCVWRHTSLPPWQQSSFEWPNGGSWVSTGLEADGIASTEIGPAVASFPSLSCPTTRRSSDTARARTRVENTRGAQLETLPAGITDVLEVPGIRERPVSRIRRDARTHRGVIDLVGFLRAVALATAPPEAPPAHQEVK